MHEYDSVSVIRMASKQAGRSHVVFLMGTIWCKVSSFVPSPAALLCMNIRTNLCVSVRACVCAHGVHASTMYFQNRLVSAVPTVTCLLHYPSPVNPSPSQTLCPHVCENRLPCTQHLTVEYAAVVQLLLPCLA